MSFEYPPRLKIAQLPTPIHPLKRYSYGSDGPEIYLKRDDLTGIALTGNKIRKLEFVAAEAMHLGADMLITCGGVQSNHARATAIVAAQLGLKSYLVLRGKSTDAVDGNLFLDRLVDAQIRFITPEDYRNRVDEIMEEAAESLRSRGLRPYIIPEGASNELGAMGYAAATEEIITQLNDLQLRIDAIVCATGSGGTQAGLIIGKQLYRQSYEVYGVNVCDDEEYFIKRIHGILGKAVQRFGMDLKPDESSIHIIDGYVGEGYALNTQPEIELIENFARKEGIILDPVYTVKAFRGLLDQILKGRFRKSDNILFLHSGGIFGLFPKKELFSGSLLR